MSFNLSTYGSGGLGRTAKELGIARFIAGQERFARTVRAKGAGPPPEETPAGSAVEHEVVVGDGLIRIVAGDGWTATVLYEEPSNTVEIHVTARSSELASTVADALHAAVPPGEVPRDTVEADLWFRGRRDAGRRRRIIECPRWGDIAGNYPAEARLLLSAVMELDPPSESGRLLLWHGEPGTGKTTAIRALAREWSSWARTHYVMDAEKFFEDPEYMLGVLLEDAEILTPLAPEWKLLVVEDADQFLVTQARREAGGGLGRLLNVTDGIVGQGLKVLVLITTNEPIAALHPAVVRPGRCLAKIEFSRFSAAESRVRLGSDSDVPSTGLTLAELYERQGTTRRLFNELATTGPGLYL